jgi:hypothetical protein
VLKLTHVVSWSWLCVLSPLWISVMINVFVYGFLLLAGCVIMLYEWRKRRFEKHKWKLN